MNQVKMHTLSNGVEIPMIGMGTFRSADSNLQDAIRSAREVGYTSFDTAWIYGNEQDVAKGLAGANRKELFITDKLWNSFQGYDSTLKAFEVTLSQLETDYLDLYLVHWPGKDKFVETWKAFEKLYKEKRIRAIGVSNFLVHHLEVLLDSCEIAPMVNQLETHCYYVDYKTLDFCKKNNILVEAWAPLGFGSDLLKEPILTDIAKAHSKTTAQVALRFLIENGIRVIPKSVHANRQKENFEIFDFSLTDAEMAKIKTLDKKHRLHEDPDIFF